MNLGAAAKAGGLLNPAVMEASPMGRMGPAAGIMAGAAKTALAQPPPAARPAQPGATNVAVQPQNPAEPPAPATGVDFGGSNDPQMNAWLNSQAGHLDYPRHPKGGHFLTGPFKGK